MPNPTNDTNREEAVRRAYDILTARYQGDRAKTYLLFWRLFEGDTQKLWSRTSDSSAR